MKNKRPWPRWRGLGIVALTALLLLIGMGLPVMAEVEAEDSLYVKHCRVDTIGWVAKVCETYFTWEPSTPNFSTGCESRSGDAVYAVANRLVWNRKEKPPTFHWIVRTKRTCWYVLIGNSEKDIIKDEIKVGELIEMELDTVVLRR